MICARISMYAGGIHVFTIVHNKCFINSVLISVMCSFFDEFMYFECKITLKNRLNIKLHFKIKIHCLFSAKCIENYSLKGL